tara:strand:- start:31 stop:666 length:636 start_codon:yes stop_codon:yes gene_type:complete
MTDLSLIYKNGLLPKKEVNYLSSISEELIDTLNKKQIFRTETEMRVSVLNDGKHPTSASKYWQAVREQAAMVEALINMGFQYRKAEVELKRIKRKLKSATGLDKEDLEIDLEQHKFNMLGQKAAAFDRMREVRMWSQIKKELDDGSFDTKNVNTHQKESLLLTLQNRSNCMTAGSSQAEALNVFGPLHTIQRMNNINSLESKEKVKLRNNK